MYCSKCGNQLQDGARFCSKCGCEVKNVEAAGSFFSDEVNSTAVADTEVNDYAEKPEVKSSVEYCGEKSKAPWIVAGILAVVTLIAVAVVVLGANFFIRTFKSPKEYYSYIEKRNAKSKIEYLIKYYSAVVLDELGGDDKGLEQTVKLEVSDDVIDVAEQLTGVDDLGFLRQIDIKSFSNVSDNMSSGNIGIGLNNTDIISFDVINDPANMRTYLNIPEISDKYIEVYVDDVERYSKEAGDVMESANGSASLAEVCKLLPKAAEASKLLEEYSDIIFDNVSDVELDKDTLKIEDVSQTCYVLTVNLNEEDLRTIGMELRRKASEDEALEDIIKSFAKVYGEDGDKIWDSFNDELYDLEELLPAFSGAVLKTYVSSNGTVIAREIISDSNDLPGISIFWGTVTKSRRFGTMVSVTEYGNNTVTISGSGKKSGEKYVGDFEIYDDMHSYSFTVDTFDLKAFKELNPKWQVSMPIGQFGSLAGFHNGELQFLDSYSMVVSVDSELLKNSAVSAKLVADDNNFALNLDYSLKRVKGQTIVLPMNAVRVDSATAIKNYLIESNIGAVNSNLRNAGVPESMMNTIESLEGYIGYLDIIDYMY